MTDLKDAIFDMSVQDMTNISFDCDCGHTHSVSIGTLDIGENASDRVASAAKQWLGGRILLVADCHTFPILGEKVRDDLKAAGAAQVDCFVFPERHLIPDTRALGALLVEASASPCALMIAVGSGSINDTTRFVSHRLGIPYIIVGTAPSMDGYAGSSCPIVCRGTKETFLAHYAEAVILDTKILAGAPQIMLCAGYGDIIGKYIALSDWQVAQKYHGDYYCPRMARLMGNATDKCIGTIEGAEKRDPAAMQTLAEALCLAGMVMGLAGVTRPASGAEHHMSHYVDVTKIARGEDYPLHGNSVGVFALVMSRVYKMANEDGRMDITTASPEYIEGLLDRLGSPKHPSELGFGKEDFRQCLLHSYKLRPRYTLMTYASEQGFLPEYADRLADEYYGK